jgi:uncharacterized linocin/CFP29 family protein
VAVTDHLLRDLAPIPTRAWKVIDDEARERLTPLLAARRLAEWVGGGGWARDATSLGRTTELTDLPPGLTADEVRARRRQVLPLAEFRVPFTVLRSEIDDIQRGARDPELDDLARAARLAAEFENRVVFHGWPAADIVGIAAACPYPTIALGLDCAQYPGIVARAVDTLRRNGIEGPYALAIGPAGYTRIVETTEHGGYLLVDHLTRVLGGEVVWSPGLDGALLLSQRGGDFLLSVGQDWSVGYTAHDAESVQLYLEETLTFRAIEPDAVIVLADG